ncbi:MAG: 4Fe-4S binding protein [Chloroflexi bacterium]|nr:4Fe-4S binding protein [Chloroflexota bacterium]
MALKSWRELPIGGVILESGSSVDYLTGGWRAERPIIDMDRCTSCMICWIFCPEGGILVEESKVTGIDMDHCKGCGICALECPPKVIKMVQEVTALEGEQGR